MAKPTSAAGREGVDAQPFALGVIPFGVTQVPLQAGVSIAPRFCT